MAKRAATWKRVKFGEITQCVNDRVDDPKSAGVDRYVGLEHLDPESLAIRRWGTPDDVESTKLRFKPGDIIFGKRRAYQRKLAVADFEGICSAHAMVLRAKPDAVVPEFLPFFMQSDLFMDRAIAISVGSLSPTINWKTLAAEEFALPPLEEQRRLTTLLGGWQANIDCLGEALRAAKTLHEAAAFTTFSKVMPMLEIGKAVRTSAFGPRFSAQGYARDDTANAWTVRTTDFTPEAISFAQVPGATLDVSIVKQHRLEDDDVLLSRSGEYAGMVRVFRQPAGDARAYIPAAFLIRFRLDPAVLLPEYLATYCRSPQGAARVRALASGSAQPNISGTAFSSLKIPVPSLSEQRSMTHELAELRTTMTQLEQREAGARTVLRSALETRLQKVAS